MGPSSSHTFRDVVGVTVGLYDADGTTRTQPEQCLHSTLLRMFGENMGDDGFLHEMVLRTERTLEGTAVHHTARLC